MCFTNLPMRYRILDLLYADQGKYVSGQMICDELDVSRTAVWKHVNMLRDEGYDITSSGGHGYSLGETKDILNSYEIGRRIGFSIPVHFFDSLDSTNNKAKEIAASGKSGISLVVCSRQEGGRGRMGRTFESANDKGAWCSFILKPEMDPEKALLITVAAAVAVAGTIEEAYGIKAGIKWPNDIIIDDRKVCGILTEMNCETNVINYIVLGIGINLLQEKEDFTDDVSMIAGSMYGITGLRVPRSEIIASLCYNIQEVYRLVLNDEADKILELWNEYNITDGREIVIIRNGESMEAKAIGITRKGSLVARSADGGMNEYNSGEISIRRIQDIN